MNRFLLPLLLLTGALAVEPAATSPWPLDVTRPEGVIILYQPQPERLVGNQLSGRLAASFLPTGMPEEQRTFAALWCTVTLDIDREHDVARTRAVKLTKIATPKGEMDEAKRSLVERLLSDAIVAKGLEIDLDRLAATLEEVQEDQIGPAQHPPKILVQTEPSMLLVCDGDPIWRYTKDGVQRLVNTPAFVASVGSSEIWMRAEDDWIVADALEGPWRVPAGDVPTQIRAAAVEAQVDTHVMRVGTPEVPAVIVATSPTELLTFDGAPQFKPVGDGALLIGLNTDNDVLVEVATGNHYALLAGRWFRSPKLIAGAWTQVAPHQLPAAFAELPSTEEFADLRAHIAGTDEAREAVAMAQVPQTARVPRSATITVSYDGEPTFVAIEDSPAQYAVNTADAVFLLPGGAYYCCRDGVWYEAISPKGPWKVATTMPEPLRRLPKSCPWSNCSAVEIYESDDDSVWCGYTPDYVGSYIYDGVPVYGSGWWYRGYWGAGYYPCPRPITWGVGIRYSPWTGGWAVGIGVRGPGWAAGAVRVGGGWWGPAGMPPPPPAGWRPGSIRPGARPMPYGRTALYDRIPGAERPHLQDRVANHRPVIPTNIGPQSTPQVGAQSARRNDVFVDRDGQIARAAADGGWQQRDQGGWKDLPKPTRPENQPGQRPVAQPGQRPIAQPKPSIQQSQQQRQRGEQRVQRRVSAPSRPVRSGGGRVGGGGRGGGIRR